MADMLKNIITGISIFFGASLTFLLVNLILTNIIPAFENGLGTNSDLSTMMLLGVHTIFILIGLVLPHYFFIEATKGTNKNKIQGQITGVILFIMSALLLLKANYMINAVGNVINGLDTFVGAVYWIGIIGVYLQLQFIIPYYTIIKSGTNNE